MNINFKPQPEPKFNHRLIVQKNVNESPFTRTSGTYFLSRHSPHPRTVCHIQGLNNAPVCVVKDAGNFSRQQITSKIIIPQQEHDKLVLTGMAMGATSANQAMPSFQAYPSKGKSPSWPGSYHRREELAELSKRTRNWTDSSITKEDTWKKQLETRPPSATGHDVHLSSLNHPSSPIHSMYYRPGINSCAPHVPGYLDQEIKILEKLCNILQTDSLAEIHAWLSNASLREKEVVSNLVRSEMTGRDLLSYQQHALNTDAEENLTFSDTLKAPAINRTEPREGVSQLRPSSKASEASRGMEQERDQEGHLFTRQRNTSPVSESLRPRKPANRPRTEMSRSPAAALQRPHLRYTRTPLSQRVSLSREEIPRQSH
ncbi:uncharacterized protein C4orf17 homolog isoform X1 [Alligator sinensis]|uniref:Uncharacterized protein C4orf17 homolog isoform X1 n=1 Tax=Alligator sinensis TaxID=38654 RepID=A0A1U7RPM4_ALLSI|nr:uncharacterized protein C4orf17 homolog isoform X1 [Alligator sinensis]XP_006023744.1 uncharacterized protein C4orf17 homolog isoform X1 [Alligator sinensis]XP_014375473.1 uncharacterized protein C4orf17 homolog isoform X1 [Alligator sinensis]